MGPDDAVEHLIAALRRRTGFPTGVPWEAHLVSTTVIGLLADPDLPAALTERLAADLPRRAGTPDAVVDVVQDPFESRYPDYARLMDKARERVRDTEWDVAVCVTDLPLREGPDVVVARLDPKWRVAVVSVPALGGVRLLSRLRALVLPLIAALAERRAPADLPGLRVGGPDPDDGGDGDGGDDDDGIVDIVRAGRYRRAALLAGMVRANRPWQLVLGLSTALAGAMTGVAFGVLYSTIWSLATALHPLRLATIAVAATTAMSVWIIAGHRLWEAGPARRMRNASTLITVALGTVAFFGALFAIALAAAAVVIPPDYLGDTLGRRIGVESYIEIALMASALGTLAGAVGSGLEDHTTVRKAAYGNRELERSNRASGS